MSETRKTFWEILAQYSIEIPMIQRDYAQGRKEGNAPKIRQEILCALRNALTNRSPLNFDFIYGRVEEVGKIRKFVPIDGQQRLTTLFLLHLYLAHKEGVSQKYFDRLACFSYKTRTSSQEFCKGLVENALAITTFGPSITEMIQDMPWYVESWNRDPTVAAMLVVLEEIHGLFSTCSGLFDSLTAPDSPLVTFEFSEMTSLALDDNVYIKMNSRGKALTDFENFKARFEQFLEKTHSTELKKDFATKIDGKWTDFFWKYRSQNLIDECFMTFFRYATKIIYYFGVVTKDSESTKVINFEIEWNDCWPEVYSDLENVRRFFGYLNRLEKWSDTSEIFKSFLAGNDFEDGKVAVFNEEMDLFRRCINRNSFQVPEEVFLFMALTTSLDVSNPSEAREFADRVRVVRNRLSRVRYLKWPEYVTQLRYEYMPQYLHMAHSIATIEGRIADSLVSNVDGFSRIPSDTIDQEVAKATAISTGIVSITDLQEAEDFRLLRGSISVLMSVNEKVAFYDRFRMLRTIWESKDAVLITKAMIASGFHGIEMGGSAAGTRWFFGHADHWATVLTNWGKENEGIEALLVRFSELSEDLSVSERLKSIVKCWIDSNPGNRTWKYYFLKYHNMLVNEASLFAWKDRDSNFEIRRLRNKTARGFHVNPYVFEVATLIADLDICEPGRCYDSGDRLSPLVLKNGVRMYCKESGWSVELPQGYLLSKKADLRLQAGNGILVENSGEDRITSALNFVSELREID